MLVSVTSKAGCCGAGPGVKLCGGLVRSPCRGCAVGRGGCIKAWRLESCQAIRTAACRHKYHSHQPPPQRPSRTAQPHLPPPPAQPTTSRGTRCPSRPPTAQTCRQRRPPGRHLRRAGRAEGEAGGHLQRVRRAAWGGLCGVVSRREGCENMRARRTSGDHGHGVQKIDVTADMSQHYTPVGLPARLPICAARLAAASRAKLMQPTRYRKCSQLQPQPNLHASHLPGCPTAPPGRPLAASLLYGASWSTNAASSPSSWCSCCYGTRLTCSLSMKNLRGKCAGSSVTVQTCAEKSLVELRQRLKVQLYDVQCEWVDVRAFCTMLPVPPIE